MLKARPPLHPAAARTLLAAAAREPLVLFLVVALAIFAFNRIAAGTSGGDTLIEVTAGDVARLEAAWSSQYQRPPTADERAMMVDDYVKEEILYREALKLGLDRDDAIVRRRLAQKLSFLSEDLASLGTPSESDLGGYYAAHKDDFTRPERISFVHVYFSGDRDNAEGRAREALAALSSEDEAEDAWRGLGDPFMLQTAYSERTHDELVELLGAPFADAAMAAAADEWIGPVRSPYGWHLVRVGARFPAELRPFAEVRDRVLAAFEAQRRRDANAKMFEALRARYKVTIDAPATGTSP